MGRAKQHINDLNRAVDAYLAERPMRVVRGQYPKTGEIKFFIKTEKTPPEELSLILGDAVHNLRSALDLLIFAMVGDQAPQPERVLFPFSKDAKGLGSTIANRQVHIASKEVIDELHALKPYPGGNELLSGLHALDVRDKHHLILTVGRAAQMTGDELGAITGMAFAGPGVITFGNATGIARQKIIAPRQWRRRTPDTEKETDIQPAFTICFGKSEPFSGGAVIPILGRLVAEVETAIADLTAAYLR